MHILVVVWGAEMAVESFVGTGTGLVVGLAGVAVELPVAARQVDSEALEFFSASQLVVWPDRSSLEAACNGYRHL